MNKKVLLGVGAVVVVGLVIYFLMMNKSPKNAETSSDNSSPSTQQASQKKSLKDLMASGSQKCQYQDGQSSGVVYTSNGKSRMDFTVNSGGQAMSTHSIMDSQTYYTWVDGQSTGFKFAASGMQGASANQQAQTFDVNKALDYNCGSWSADSSMFTPPTNVTFTDYSSFTMPTGN